MADKNVEVRTPKELYDALNTKLDNNSNYTNTINIMNDIDFNDEKFYYHTGNFFNITNGGTSSNAGKLIINGNGHTLSNIYIFKDRSLFYVSNHIITFEINDTKFEIVSNTSYILNTASTGASISNTNFYNCTFNVKIASIDNTHHLFKTINKFNAVNCIFNVHIGSCSSDSISSLFVLDSKSSTDWNAIFEGCEFKLTNNCPIGIDIFDNAGYNSYILLDNCALFLKDTHKFYDAEYTTSDSLYDKTINSFEFNKIAMQNSFIATLGDIHTPNGLCLIRFGYHNQFYSSFYDKEKILPFIQRNNSSSNLVCDKLDKVSMKGLTTEQCKSPEALNDIGFSFAEEVY